MALAQHHAGDEGTQRHRQAELVGQQRCEHRHQQRRQHEQLLRVCLGHLHEHPRQHPLADADQRREQHQALDHRDHQHQRQPVAGTGHGRDQDQEQHRRQVLEQQHRHAELTVAGIQFAAAGQLARHHRGGRQRQHRRHQQCQVRRQSQADAHRHERRGGNQHLPAAQAEHQPAHGQQARQRELQPQREQQEHHAELGHHLHGFLVVDQAEGAGADQHAGGQVPERRRQAQAVEHRQHQRRGGEDDDQLVEKAVHQATSPRRPASTSSTAPASTMGRHNSWPMVSQSKATKPRNASGWRANSPMKRSTP